MTAPNYGQPNPFQQQPVTPPKPKKHRGLKIAGGITAAVFAIGLIGNLGDDGDDDLAVAPDVPAATQPAQPTEQATTEPREQAKPTKHNTHKPKQQGPTFAQQQALAAANDYLDMMAFSKKGLREQLEYDGFPKADAKWAVNHVITDWKVQAVLAAEDYLDTMPMSKAELIDQLEYDGFTPAQAEHGASVAYRNR
jgi:hypothetical protein